MRRFPTSRPFRRSLAALLLLVPVAAAGAADPAAELRSAFDHFVVAQNAHDLRDLRGMMVDSPDFLWITRGQPIWGREAALARFDSLYRGTWKLAPERDAFRVVFAREGTAEIFCPVTFTIGPRGQTPQTSRFLMNQVWHRDRGRWRLVSLLPIPVPAPAAARPDTTLAPSPRDSAAAPTSR